VRRFCAYPTALGDLKQRLTGARALPLGVGVSAAGKAQAIALQFGKGQWLCWGNRHAFSSTANGTTSPLNHGKDVVRMGMNRSGFDNRQLALNIMHWLSKLLSWNSRALLNLLAQPLQTPALLSAEAI